MKFFYMKWLVTKFEEAKTLPKLSKKERNILLVDWIKFSWGYITFDTIRKSFEFCTPG